MQKSTWRAWFGLLAWLPLVGVLAAGAGRADVGPPPDYKDACKEAGIARDQPGCTPCVLPDFKNPDCAKRAAADGLEQRCRGWNYAMWCPKTAVAEPAPAAPATASQAAAEASSVPAAAPKKGCASGGAEGLGALGVTLAWILARRGARC